MAKFNTKTTIAKKVWNHEDRTCNKSGSIAFKLEPKLELIQRVLTWFVNEPKFYGNTSSELNEIRHLVTLVAEEDPEFILKLAYKARNEFLLRTAPVFLLIEASLIDECKPFIREYTPYILTRADQMTEAVAYLKERIGDLGDAKSSGSMPASLKKGIAEAFGKFDEYALSKYNRDGDVKLRDVLRLVHPKPRNKTQSRLYKSIIEDTIDAAETWEKIISTEGSNKETWTKASKVMGYMALLRNLRNLLEKEVDMSPIIKKLTDEEGIRKSRQLPFRFVSAYREVQDVSSAKTSKVLDAIVDALDKSVGNLKKYKGRTAIVVDHSGSMNHPISSNTNVSRMDTADILAAIGHGLSDEVITMVFSDVLDVVNLSSRSTIIDNLHTLRRNVRSGGTATSLPFNYLTNNHEKVDRIILLTDEESNTGTGVYEAILRYRKTVNPKAFVHIINLGGYGTSEVPDDDKLTSHLAGYNDKVLDFIRYFEKGRDSIVKEIDSVEL